MPSVNLSPVGNSQVVDSAGDPATGWKWNTYLAGTSTPQATYTTADGDVAQSNPVVINSLGLPTTGLIFLVENIAYKLVLTNAADVVQKTYDDITGVAIVSAASFNEWISYTAAPTYISATSFSVAGDQRSIFNVGRRLKTTNTGGTIYSTIKTSAFTSLTTITVINDSGTLDAGLSAVNYGLLSATNPSTPLLADTYPVVSGSADKTKKIRLEADGLTTDTTRVITMPDRDVNLGTATSSAEGLVEFSTQAEFDAGTPLRALGTDINLISLGTVAATTSGSSHSFTGIPAGTRRITFTLSGVSISGTDFLILQIGPVAGVETTGYLSTGTYLDNAAAVSGTNVTTSFQITPGGNAANIHHGSIVFDLLNSSTNLWTCRGTTVRSNSPSTFLAGGSKALAGALEVITIDTSGTDTFDAGSVNITYER